MFYPFVFDGKYFQTRWILYRLSSGISGNFPWLVFQFHLYKNSKLFPDYDSSGFWILKVFLVFSRDNLLIKINQYLPIVTKNFFSMETSEVKFRIAFMVEIFYGSWPHCVVAVLFTNLPLIFTWFLQKKQKIHNRKHYPFW